MEERNERNNPPGVILVRFYWNYNTILTGIEKRQFANHLIFNSNGDDLRI